MIYKINPSISINDILRNASKGDTIRLAKGIYNEKVIINTDGIHIVGEDMNETIIRNKDYYHKIMSDNNECNTFRTYTVYCGGNNVTLKNLTIENTAVPSKKFGQAVALHVNCDNFLCENCIITSAQDTLFTGPLPLDLLQRYKNFLPSDQQKANPMRQVYKNCVIYGDVDFIFGGATALFEACTIKCIEREHSTSNIGYIAAPSHSLETKYGYLFYNCNIETLDPDSSIFLARPWRDYGCAAFINCKLGKQISPLGFDKWNDTNRDKTARFYEYTENTNLADRVSWAHQLTKDEATEYYNNFLAYLR